VSALWRQLNDEPGTNIYIVSQKSWRLIS